MTGEEQTAITKPRIRVTFFAFVRALELVKPSATVGPFVSPAKIHAEM